MASSATTFSWLIGEDLGVEHTLVLGVELNSEGTQLKSEATPSEQPVWSITGAEKNNQTFLSTLLLVEIL